MELRQSLQRRQTSTTDMSWRLDLTKPHHLLPAARNIIQSQIWRQKYWIIEQALGSEQMTIHTQALGSYNKRMKKDENFNNI